MWVWLPGSTAPVPAGRVVAEGEVITFNYGRSYLERPDAIPLYLPELPLQRGRQRPRGAMPVAGVIRDGGPDAWGQRVILARHLGRLDGHDTAELGLLTYLLESGATGSVRWTSRTAPRPTSHGRVRPPLTKCRPLPRSSSLVRRSPRTLTRR